MSTNPTRIATLSTSMLAIVTLGACATVEETVAEAVAETKRATLTGAEVVGRGDPDGYAKAELTVTDELNQVCYDINDLRNLGSVTSAGIYRGAQGVTGTLVVRLREANEGGWKNCVGRAEWLEDRLERSSGAYYIQLSTRDFPNGAVRGQFY